MGGRGGGRGGEKEKQIKERESWEEKEEERENAGSQGNWGLGKRREGRRLKFRLSDVSLQLLGVPAPQPCSPGALAASCADWRSELEKREQHDPTCLEEGRNTSAIKSSLAASLFP